ETLSILSPAARSLKCQPRLLVNEPSSAHLPRAENGRNAQGASSDLPDEPEPTGSSEGGGVSRGAGSAGEDNPTPRRRHSWTWARTRTAVNRPKTKATRICRHSRTKGGAGGSTGDRGGNCTPLVASL